MTALSRINAVYHALFFLSLLFAFSLFAYYDARQCALHSTRRSFSGLHSPFNDSSTQILGFITEDDRISHNAHVEIGRWQCDHLYGSIIVHKRVVTERSIVLSVSPTIRRTLVSRCRIAAYRPRRNKGRIKLCFKRRKSRLGEQMIDEKVGDVLYFVANGDKMDLPFPRVTNCRTYGLSLLSHLRSAMLAQLSCPDDLDAAAAGQSECGARSRDLRLTILNAPCFRTKGRAGPWIHRSPTHTQRESSNAKFHCQWHERVVVYFGLLTCITLTQLTIKPTTLVSDTYETLFIETFSFYLSAISILFSFLPQTSNSNVIKTVKAAYIPNGRSKQRPDLTLAHNKLPLQTAPGQDHTARSAKDGEISCWFDPTNNHRFFANPIQRRQDGQSQQLRKTWPKTTIARKDAQTFTVNDVVSKSFLSQIAPDQGRIASLPKMVSSIPPTAVHLSIGTLSCGCRRQPRPLPVRATSFSLPKMERSFFGSIPPTTIAFPVSLFPSLKQSLSRF